MYIFKQSAYILLDATPPPERIHPLLSDQGFPILMHEHGIDLLTRATSSMVYEVVMQTENRASILIDVMNGPWPDIIPDKKNDPVTFVSWHAAAFGAFVYPGCLERAVQECRVWPDAKKAARRHRALLRIRYAYERDSTDPREGEKAAEEHSPFDELVSITRLLLALNKLPGVLGYFFPAGEALCSSELMLATWETYIRHGKKPFDLWIMWINRRIGHTPEAPDWAILDTCGLSQLHMADIEACFQHTRYQPTQVANWLLNVASYLYENGPIIEDGHTLTGPGGTNWQAYHFESSLQFPPRSVLCMRPQDGSRVPQRFLKRIPVPPL